MKQIFESERISFTEVSEALIPEYLIMLNDVENVQRPMGAVRGLYTEEKEVKWVRQKLAEKAQVFSMIEKDGGGFIGNIELMHVTDFDGELGIALTGAKQNLGYGTEAVRALTAYAFEKLGLQRVCLRTHPKNARAIHVYMKCGFREYDRNDEHVFMEIMRADHV